MDTVSFSIDGLNIDVERGTTILEAALRNGVYIPHLCYCPDLRPAGTCRLCLVDVGGGRLATSCRTPAEDGMSVSTQSPEVDRVRRAVAELLIANHHTDCRNCPGTGHCELQRIMARLRLSAKRMRPLRWAEAGLPLDTSNPFFDYDPNRCVLCGLCIRTCDSIRGVSALQFVGRGYGAKVVFFGDPAKCESCLQCAANCPVGGLLPKNASAGCHRSPKRD